MQNYNYQNILINKKQLRQLLAWSFTNYDSMQACALADELKYLGFKYASRAGISINIEDLQVPFTKRQLITEAAEEMAQIGKVYLKGRITDVERFQKMIDNWNYTSEMLKRQIVYYFKNYDPLNSLYIMSSSGARGSLAQVRQLVGIRGLMADPSGQILNVPIENNFREGLTVTDYLMSGYGARKGIIDTALKTANAGYLTRRLIDVGQDILIREKDCFTNHSFLLTTKHDNLIYDKVIGRVLNKPIIDPKNQEIIAQANVQITPKLIKKCKEKNIKEFYIRSPLTCKLYRAICQKCYGWDLATENLVDMGEAIGILAGQSIGEPGTQLTMRTFHTGGVFTSSMHQQVLSPISGIIKYHKRLNTVLLRTNRGEEVSITKNSGSLIIVPDDRKQSIVKIPVLQNTIIFPKHNQYILQNKVLGELLNSNKQIKKEQKPILSANSGEIFMPELKDQLFNKNKLIWILSGQFYNSPKNSFLNFHPDHKLLQHSYVFRTKIINHYNGQIKLIKNQLALNQKVIRIINHKYSLIQSKLQRLTKDVQYKNYLLSFNNTKYLLKIQTKNSELYLQLARNLQLGVLITQTFQTLTGGTVYYNSLNNSESNRLTNTITYVKPNPPSTEDITEVIEYKLKPSVIKYKPLVSYRTIIWLGEEIHNVNCELKTLLVKHGDFIPEKTELIPNIFSKTSGIVIICQKLDSVQTISIQRGLTYEFFYKEKNREKILKKLKSVYYPGEVVLSTFYVKNLSFCDHIFVKNRKQLFIRPIDIYECPYLNKTSISSKNDFNWNSDLKLESKIIYCYESNQTVKGAKNISLISNILCLKFNKNKILNSNTRIKLYNSTKNSIDFQINEKLILNNHITPQIRYTNIKSCFLIQPNQFIDRYTILGYLEATTLEPLNIVKFKIKKKNTKQILLISNKDCFIVKRSQFPNKKLNDFIININNTLETGKIILMSKNFLILQKSKLYFFPNCKKEKITELRYKIIPSNYMKQKQRFHTKKLISLNYYDLTRLSVQPKTIKSLLKNKITTKIQFSRLFVKKNGKVYSSLIPKFSNKFKIHNNNSEFIFEKITQSNWRFPSHSTDVDPIGRTLLLRSSKFVKNRYKKFTDLNDQLVFVRVLKYPFMRSTKSVGLYSITDDFFQHEINSIFCKNKEFIEKSTILGFLNLEKEITGDIVQGLPRIEKILEARKNNLTIKRIPTCKKKGLLMQKTDLDLDFNFKKLGTSIKENDKINPHDLLKAYFNYYGVLKTFFCDRENKIKYSRLIQNYEGSYKSFKQVQAFILHSVQSVYQDQGVSIHDKHLEVVIQQMTTKVLITSEGNTPLLQNEVIDLYHIQSINQIVQNLGKQPAYYVPVLSGITRTALNNPSFISAASFQETIRVLTKAGIEGRMDWLRGLKENIIIGHLIPAGTGSPTYRNSFKKELLNNNRQ